MERKHFQVAEKKGGEGIIAKKSIRSKYHENKRTKTGSRLKPKCSRKWSLAGLPNQAAAVKALAHCCADL
jgi:ATP-dependent DNA ligase